MNLTEVSPATDHWASRPWECSPKTDRKVKVFYQFNTQGTRHSYPGLQCSFCNTVKALLSPPRGFIKFGTPQRGLRETGVLFTKSNDMDTDDGFSVLQIHIVDSTVNFVSQIQPNLLHYGSSSVISGILFIWGLNRDGGLFKLLLRWEGLLESGAM